MFLKPYLLDSDKETIEVSEAERARIRCVCASQLMKMAQEPFFKPMITPDFFHMVAKLFIDPVTNVRDIMIKKLHNSLKQNRLPINYMSMFALSGFDGSRDRKSRVKKIFSQLVKSLRANDQKKQMLKNPPPRILPEMCLPFAVSLLAHNCKIDSLKDETKVKQIKECMNIVLDPLLESPDSQQIAYIKTILNKIKVSDDGMAAAAVQVSAEKPNSKLALQNLYQLNKNLCFICEIFMFHMHSKSSVTGSKEYQFEVKLPGGFYAARDNNNSNGNGALQQQIALDKEIAQDVKDANQSLDKIIGDDEDKEEQVRFSFMLYRI